MISNVGGGPTTGEGREQFIIIGTVNMSSMSALTPPTLTVVLLRLLQNLG